MKCPHCGKQIADSSQFCEYCGKPIKKQGGSPKGLWIVIVLLSLVVGLLAGIMIYRMSADTGPVPTPIEPWHDTIIVTQPDPAVEETVAEPKPVSDFPRRDAVVSLLNRFAQYEQSDDFDGLEELYAPQLLRYHSKKNMSRREVMECHRNYNTKFGVYGKSSSFRWETLSINRISDTRAEVVCVKDYHIDRVDENKPSNFVLEQHFVIDNNYQVVSIYDNQLSKY
jgi:hypothetical protein